MASSALTLWNACTYPLPPMLRRLMAAFGPITASDRSLVASSGSRFPSFLSSTIACAPAARTSCWCSAQLTIALSTVLGPSSSPTRMIVRRIRRTFSSISSRLSFPCATSGPSFSGLMCAPVGISRSVPPVATPSGLCAAPQSVITTPSKPHSSFSTVFSRYALAEQYGPLRRL